MATTTADPLTVTLTATQRAGTSRAPAKDAEAIAKLKANYEAMAQGDRNTAERMYFSYYKTLGSKLDEVDTVIADNEKKSGEKNKKSAPITDQKAVAPEWKRILGILMAGVPKEFQHWAIIARGMADNLAPQARDIAFYGITENKRVVKKGAFVFFLTDNEMKLWVSTMTQIGAALINRLLANDMLPIKGPVDIPTDKQGWLALIKDNNKNDAIVPAPALDDVREFFHAAMLEVMKEGKITEAMKQKFEFQLEVFTLVRPSRLLLTRDRVKAGKLIPKKLATGVMESYKQLAKLVSKVFKIKTFVQSIRDQKTMNQIAAETISIYNNLIPQYRAVRRGGEKGRLTAKESRLVEDFEFSFSF
jgi:hypothetical protein